MTRSRIMNLKTGLTFCWTCGNRYSWDIQCCPFCAKRKEDEQREAAPTVDEQEQISAAQAEQYRKMSEGLPDGIIDHDDALEGAWK